MKNIQFWTKSLLLILLFGFTAQKTVAQTKTYKEVPKKLHGFWQFDVKNKGDWNGMHVGKNYIELLYNLIKIDSVTQKSSNYVIYLGLPNGKSEGITLTPTDKNSATFNFGDKKSLVCKRFDADPDIELLPVAEYSKAINGEWVMGNDVRNPLFIKKDKLTWDNEEWKIVWLGEYLQREFRALIEKDGEYKLIYITPQNENSKKFVFANKAQFYRPMPPVNKKNIYGTWCDKKTNDWVIGFFDKIAVYKNQSWKYKVTKQKKNSYTIELQKGDKNQTLFLTLKGKKKDKCKLKDGKTKTNLIYTPRPLPYNYPDTTSFVNNDYKMDTVTINGYVEDKSQKLFLVEVPTFLGHRAEKYYGNIDKNGCFTVKFPVASPTQILMEQGTFDVVEPGETYFLYIGYDYKKRKEFMWYMGENARFHQEVKTSAGHYIDRKKYPRLYAKVDSGEHLKECYEIYNKRQEQLNNQLDENPMLSERFRIFKKRENSFEFAYNIMKDYVWASKSDKERLSKKYMQIADSMFLPLVTAYPFTFDYLFLMDSYHFFSQYIACKTEQTHVFSSNKYDKFLEQFVKSQKVKDLLYINDAFIDLEMNYMNRNVRKKIMPLSETQMKYYNERIKNKNLRKILEIEQQKFIEMSKKEVKNDIKPITELSKARLTDTKDAKDADELLKKITEPHLGKVIYIDIWGTWCGPCKEELRYAKKIKEAMKDKDVVFIYFANNSPEKAWKHIIKENGIIGKNTIHYNLPTKQQSIIERRLGIKSYPTFIIIDKKGNIVNMSPPRPSQGDLLITELHKWLKK